MKLGIDMKTVISVVVALLVWAFVGPMIMGVVGSGAPAAQ